MAPFTDKIERKDFEKMPKEYQELLVRVLKIQADCEIGGPHIYVKDWLLRAPTADDQYKVAHIAAEEIDHYRKIATLVKELGDDASYSLWKPKEEREVDAFKETMPTWAHFAVFGFLIDRVGHYQLQEFYECSYLPLARLLPPYDNRVIHEEMGHISYGMNQLREIMKTDEGKQQAQEALDHWFPIGLDMFGKSKSRRSEKYIELGLKRRTNEQARKEYIAEVIPLIQELGLKVPDLEKDRRYL